MPEEVEDCTKDHGNWSIRKKINLNSSILLLVITSSCRLSTQFIFLKKAKGFEREALYGRRAAFTSFWKQSLISPGGKRVACALKQAGWSGDMLSKAVAAF